MAFEDIETITKRNMPPTAKISYMPPTGRGKSAGKSKDQGVEPKQLMHAFIFRFGYVPRLGDDHFDGEHRPVKKISDDEFEIDVPKSWFAPPARND